jgi:hypothetical protein
MKTVSGSPAVFVATAAGLMGSAGEVRAQFLITGNDEKISFDENGKRVDHPPGKDTVSVIDIRARMKPKIVANLPLMNTIVGPPVNLAITGDQRLALVANSLDWVADGDIEKASVRAEGDAVGESCRTLFRHDVARLGASCWQLSEQQGRGITAGRAHRQPFRCVLTLA